MEALLVLSEWPELCDPEMRLFHGTWGFLASLQIMQEGQDDLALSYDPWQNRAS